MNFRRTPRSNVIGGAAAAVAAVVMLTGGIGQAAAVDGPVLYLSNHGSPTDCNIEVAGTLTDGSPYNDTVHRQSCDGTLWMPVLQQDTPLSVKVTTSQPQGHSAAHEFQVKDARDPDKDYIDNMTAICFLVKAFGEVGYTNMSAKGGDCNGA